jgi:hypothetical protein
MIDEIAQHVALSLPKPVVLEATCRVMADLWRLHALVRASLPAATVIPVPGPIIVGGPRLVFDIRERRRRVRLAYRRSDIDDMLDLDEQLGIATKAGREYLDYVDAATKPLL